MIIELSISEENGYFNSKYENDELDIIRENTEDYFDRRVNDSMLNC